MNTKEVAQEQISALADGELEGSQVDLAFAALRDQERQADWVIYHQIGEVLRSDDMAVRLSPGFSARMSALLEQEPAIVAPMRQPDAAPERARRRWTIPSMAAAAAVATVAFVTTPQLMVAMKGDTAAPGASTAIAVSAPVADTPVVAAKAPEGVILRDPRIDDYLLAHQRLSPSFYSTAQYARSAAFANESNK